MVPHAVPPAVHLTLHVSSGVVVPATVAVNCLGDEIVTLGVWGLMVTVTPAVVGLLTT